MDMNINAAAYKSYSKYSELWYIFSYRSHQLIQSFISPLLSFPFFPNILPVLLFFFCFSLPQSFILSFPHSILQSFDTFFFSFFLSIFLFIFLSFFFSFYLFFFLSVYLFLMISVLRAKCYLEHREKR